MNLKSKISWTPGLKLDLAANFVGIGWYAVLQLACIPLYLKFLVIEAYGLIGIAIGALMLAASPVIAKHWIRAGSVSIREVQRAVMLMGALAVFQWPVSFYQGGLMGLRRQVLSNAVNVLFSTLANGGAVLVLWKISPTIQAFFVWLIAVNATKAIT